jgi:MFS family permease
MLGILSKERIIASPTFNRWWLLPAALAINLSVGQAYAFSVFNLPLTKVIGITESGPGDWRLTTVGWIFTLAYVFLGLSAGVGARWLERVGPRMSGVVAALCWGFGFIISAIGVKLHQVWLLYLGYGIIGGCGLGLGFTTPIATLIRWFPDKRGMATGMAVMGFGGGAIIAAPLQQMLMNRFASPTSVGVAETFLVLGHLYLFLMLAGAFTFRLPSPGWRPAGWSPERTRTGVMVTARHVHVSKAVRTPQFRLLWLMMFLYVTAGLGVLGQASAMIQEVFGQTTSAAGAAAFVSLLSFFNMGGRLFWASLSDRIGRRTTYSVFFLLGPILYAAVPLAGHNGDVALFVAFCAVILTMYGGNFATMPPYLADIFGTQYVGAINGRLLTALSVAGIVGPGLVNYLREYQIASGVAKADAYNVTMFIMAGLLVVGFICNLMIKPVAEREFMTQAELDAELGPAAAEAPAESFAAVGSSPDAPVAPGTPYSPPRPGRSQARVNGRPAYGFSLGRTAQRGRNS